MFLVTPASTRPESPELERELLQRARAGDRTAFADLYRLLEPAARRSARRQVGPSDVDDVVAETFARVFRAIQHGRGPTDRLLPYLLYAVRTNAWLHQRRRTQEVEKALRLQHPTVQAIDPTFETDDDLRAAYASLSDRHRRVLWWFEVEGWSAIDVGAELGISPNAAAAVGYRARRALRLAYDATTRRPGAEALAAG